MDNQTLLGGSTSNEVERLGMADQGFASPIGADGAKQAMLNGVPLGSACGIMRDGDSETGDIGNFVLQAVLPKPIAIAIAATPIGKGQECGGIWKETLAVDAPPPGDSINSQLGGVSTRANKDVAAIVRWVIDAVGNSDPFGQRREIIGVHVGRSLAPETTSVAERANQFTFLGVNADDRPASLQKSLDLGFNVPKLGFAVGMRLAAQTLAVCLQRIGAFSEQTADCVWAYVQAFSQPTQAPATLLASALRLAACVPLKQFVQLLQEYGVFFSTRNRPPPVLRTRSLASACANS